MDLKKNRFFRLNFFQVIAFAIAGYLLTGLSGCDFSSVDEENKMIFTDTITVTASAYNSLQSQGEGDPTITAWGDTLVPGGKSIAVSRDLVRLGLTHGTPVRIEGFDDVFTVNDKMHQRWRNKIDIYMGNDKNKAKEWGRKKVKISYPSKQVE